MRRLNLPRITLTLFVASLLLFGGAATVFAQAQAGFEFQASPWPRLSPEPNSLSLVSSNAYTIYLPIVIYVPPSPKKGLGAAVSPACTDLQTLNTSWYTNWSINPDSTCDSRNAPKFVPRISGAFNSTSLTQAVANAQASGWLIGFTEPNLPSQANLSPTQGAILWKQIEEAAIPAGVKLASPSPSQHSPGEKDPYGNQWLWAMVAAYQSLYSSNPHFDAISWNIYKRSPGEIQNYLNARHNEALPRGYNVPFWILEYGGECWSSNNGNTSIMTTITPWFEATPWIGRYAWFANRITGREPYAQGWQSCSLINPGTGLPTSLGQIYAGF